jgi:hypothetical protein
VSLGAKFADASVLDRRKEKGRESFSYVSPSITLVFSRSHDAVIRVYDEADNVIETHEHVGDFKER